MDGVKNKGLLNLKGIICIIMIYYHYISGQFGLSAIMSQTIYCPAKFVIVTGLTPAFVSWAQTYGSGTVPRQLHCPNLVARKQVKLRQSSFFPPTWSINSACFVHYLNFLAEGAYSQNCDCVNCELRHDHSDWGCFEKNKSNSPLRTTYKTS